MERVVAVSSRPPAQIPLHLPLFQRGRAGTPARPRSWFSGDLREGEGVLLPPFEKGGNEGGFSAGGGRRATIAAALTFALAVTATAQVQFTDVSAAAGVAGDQYHSTTGHSLGVNWLDYNLDGRPDLFAVGGGPNRAPHLFRNDGDGTFTRVDELLPAFSGDEMSGSRFADVDRDGDPDLFIYTDNPEFNTNTDNLPDGPPNVLLKNLWVENGGTAPEGEALFVDVTAAAGLEDLATPPLGDLPAYRSKTAGFVDYDRDGCIDLYLGHMVMNDGGSEVNKDRLYRNLCGASIGVFEDVTASTGVNPGVDPMSYRGALAFGAFLLNDDLWPDLYVVNAAGADPQPFINDQIYMGNGFAGGGVTFTEVADEMPGIGDDSEAGMGIDVADVDLDGDWDVYLSDLLNTNTDEEPRGNVFYLNNGDGTFADNSAPEAGVVGHNSWGVNFFDVDHDGFEDLYVSTISSANTELLYMNNRDGTFTNVALAAGLATGNSRGSAVADYDGDGDLDLAVVDQGGPLRLFRNDTAGAGNWLQLRLTGTASNTDAIGTLVEVEAGALAMMRQVKGGSSAHSQDGLAVHFGLGEATAADAVRVYWPSGYETVLADVAANQVLVLVEGAIFADGFESGDPSRWSDSMP